MLRKDSDPWVRTFSVTDPIRHPKGYTLYKVTSKVFPKNSIEAVTQVTVWKRYNDFKKLHKSLHALHQGLYLKGTFPPFAKARLFGRFDDQVIEERRKCALELLEFAAKYPPLFTSQVFVKFFESGQVIENPPVDGNAESCSDPILQPTSLSVCSGLSTTQEERENGSTLGGIWQHRQPADEISISSQNATEGEDEEDDRTTFTDDDPIGSKVPIDLSEFDPILENSVLEDRTKSRTGNLCNEWLLSAFQSPNIEECDTDNNTLVFPAPFGNAEDLESRLGSPEESNQSKCDIMLPDVSDFDPLLESPAKSSPSTPTSAVPHEEKRADELGSSYIFHSAKLISAAQNAEMAGNIFEAFTLYKTAVDILLQGVKDDKSPEQSEAVRHKILQYLKRAEQLYEDHLAKGKQKDANHTYKVPSLNITSMKPSDHLYLRKPITDLAKYRVIGILARVILVVNTVSSSTCVVKVLRKSPSPRHPDMPNVAPRGIRFIVELYEVYETGDAVFLILEYASGGRLWDYMSTYLQQSPVFSGHENDFIAPESMKKSSLVNVYSAKRSEVKNLVPVTCASSPEPTVTITAVSAEDPDLTAPSTCPSSYVALFKNYLVNTVSKNDGSLAHCNIASSVSGITNSPKEHSSITVADISVDPKDSVTNKTQAFYGNSDSKISSDNVNNIITSSKALLKDVDSILHSSYNVSSVSVGVKSTNFQNSDTALRKPAPDFRPCSDNKDLQTFFSEDIGKDFINCNNNKGVEKLKADGISESKSNTLTHLSSSTGALDLSATPRPSLTDVFHQMDVEFLAAKPVHLPETCVAQWGAEIVSVLDSLHKLGIIWQDLNPDNILLGREGHILLTYQSNWNCVDHILNEDAKKNLYTAPEVGRVFPVTSACDWWSLGAILFELLTGKKLASCHPSGITSHTTLSIPDFLTPEAEDILKQLLRYNESERLGSGPHGVEDIKYHPFFHSIDWNLLNAC